MKDVDKTYENVIGGGLKLKGKVISKTKGNKKLVKTSVKTQSSGDSTDERENPDYFTIQVNTGYEKEISSDHDESFEKNPNESKLEVLNKRIEKVKNDPNLTSSEKTFKIAQIKRTYQRIGNQLKESHREKIEKFNSKLSKLSERTPLTKYDVDDFEIHTKSKRARSYLEIKELKRRQNRELINKNRIKTLYTVDTEEGWTPSEFKSSRTKRATYDFQSMSKFTDEDDSDIVSMKVLKNLKMDEKQNELRRIVKVIIYNEGYMNKVIGPQLPPNPKDYTHLRDPRDLRGIGFKDYSLRLEDYGEDNLELVDQSIAEDQNSKFLEDNNTKSNNKETNLKWVSSDNRSDLDIFPKKSMDLGVRKEDLKTYHKFDRDIDLADIKRYYKSYYEYIVKPLQDIKEETVEDLLQKYTQMPEFNKAESTLTTLSKGNVKYKDSTNTQESKKEYKYNFKGRTILKYQYSKELLNKFKIKQYDIEEPIRSTTKTISQLGGQIEETMELPPQLFSNLFGKGYK